MPARLENALNQLDTDRDGEIDAAEWEYAIEWALKAKLAQRRAQREAAAAANRKEIEEFTQEFLNAARDCFVMIDKDESGTLTKAEIVRAVSEDQDVIKFLKNCGEPNLHVCRAEILPVGPGFVIYFEWLASAFQRCKNQPKRCSHGRDPVAPAGNSCWCPRASKSRWTRSTPTRTARWTSTSGKRRAAGR